VSFTDRKIQVDVPRQFVKNAPEWNALEVNREYEARLYQYHGRPVYWRD